MSIVLGAQIKIIKKIFYRFVTGSILSVFGMFSLAIFSVKGYNRDITAVLCALLFFSGLLTENAGTVLPTRRNNSSANFV